MVTIEVDEEVYNELQKLAEPFVDTPNTVIRKMLFPKSKASDFKNRTINSTTLNLSAQQKVSSEVFMSVFLKKRYEGIFHSKSPYRTMFESQTHLVYFQNFNKFGTNNLWYRLSEGALNVLRETKKIALVCFTNPSENLVFEIPIRDIDLQAGKANWKKEFFEVNIDPANSRWRALNWDIDKYLIK